MQDSITKKIGQELALSSFDFLEQIPNILTAPELINNPTLAVTKAIAIVGAKKIARLGEEYRKRVEMGQLKSSSNSKFSDKEAQNLLDVLKTINEGIGEDKFQAMKSLFFHSISININERGENEAYTLLQICNRLSGADLLVLTKLYNYREKNNFFELKNHNAEEWFTEICKELGMVDVTVVRQHAEVLSRENLLSPFLGSSEGPLVAAENLLSQLGKRLCQYILKYDSLN